MKINIKTTIIVTLTTLLIGSMFYGVYNDNKLNKELNSIPCWKEVCTDVETINNEDSLFINKQWLFKGELVYINDQTLKYSDLYTLEDIKQTIDLETTEYHESGGITKIISIYTLYIVRDKNSNILYQKEIGDKPEWLEANQ